MTRCGSPRTNPYCRAVRFGAWLALLSLVAAAGCQAMEALSKTAADVMVEGGVITEEQGASIKKSAEAWAKAREEIDPEREHYLGRSVAATILSTYKPYDNDAVNTYVNVLGQTLALASDMPETYGGYHFLVVDSEDVNAFAAPGGLIMITRGMIRCCPNEAALAAVLAHEIGHVQGQHGLKSIEQGRLIRAVQVMGSEAAKSVGGVDPELVQLFEESVGDVTKTLLVNGYSRDLEREADKAAVTILTRVGYDPQALITMLREMKTRLKPGGLDFAKTHPDPLDRVAEIEPLITDVAAAAAPPAREARFTEALAGI